MISFSRSMLFSHFLSLSFSLSLKVSCDVQINRFLAVVVRREVGFLQSLFQTALEMENGSKPSP